MNFDELFSAPNQEPISASDDEYFDALGFAPDEDNDFSDLKALFKTARLHGVTPELLREFVEKQDEPSVHFSDPRATLNMIQMESFFNAALEHQFAEVNANQCDDLTYTPVIIIRSNECVSFEGASLIGFQKCLERTRGLSISAMEDGTFEIEMEVKVKSNPNEKPQRTFPEPTFYDDVNEAVKQKQAQGKAKWYTEVVDETVDVLCAHLDKVFEFNYTDEVTVSVEDDEPHLTVFVKMAAYDTVENIAHWLCAMDYLSHLSFSYEDEEFVIGFTV